MSDSEVVAARKRLISQRWRGRAKSEAGFHERRRAPRPRLAEIRRGASLKLLSPIVVTGVLRVVAFQFVAGLGFVISASLISGSRGFWSGLRSSCRPSSASA